MNDHAPRFSQAAQKGERGVQLVSNVVMDSLGWIFKRNHQEHDFGIDGQIEVVTPDGYLTGQLLAVQIKYGKSFFQEKNRWGYVYRGEGKHLNYLANYPIPILIVLCHPDSRACYWQIFRPEDTHAAGENWKTTIPFENDLANSKDALRKLLPPVEDHKSMLEDYWTLNQVLVDAPFIHFISDRSEVLACDTSRARRFFDRLKATKELALACQGKLEMSIFGYEGDRRELFEIPEARKYMAALLEALPELFYFSRTEQPTSTVKAFALCHTDVWFPHGRSTPLVTKQLEFHSPKLASFLERGLAGLNAMTDWLGLDDEENKRICYSVMACIGAREEDIDRAA